MSYTLTATPNPCQINPEQTHCTIQIKWGGGNDLTKLWYVLVSTGEEGVVGSGPNGDQPITWIDFRELRFELRENSQVKASVLVQGVAPSSYYHYEGGSNLLVYRLDWPASNYDGRSNHGLVFKYHEPGVRDEAMRYFKTMYDAGQRSVRIAFPMANKETNDGYTFDVREKSNYKYIEDQGKVNLSCLLVDLESIGYKRFIVALFAFDELSPYNWNPQNLPSKSHQLSLVDVYNGVIAEIRHVVIDSLQRNSGSIPAREDQMHYWIDLGNEMAPGDPEKSYAIPYMKQIWYNYIDEFDSGQDTVGFSVAADSIHSIDRVKNLYEIYTNSYGCESLPGAIDLHIYGELTTDTDRDNEYGIYVAMHNYIKKNPLLNSLPWIIGETYDNDAIVADHFAKASRDTGRQILFMTPWPLPRDRTTANCPSNVPDKSCAMAPPYSILNY